MPWIVLGKLEKGLFSASPSVRGWGVPGCFLYVTCFMFFVSYGGCARSLGRAGGAADFHVDFSKR